MYERLDSEHLSPRGFAFWNILDEGRSPPSLAPPTPPPAPVTPVMATTDNDNDTSNTSNDNRGDGDGEGRKPVYMAAGLNRFLHIR